MAKITLGKRPESFRRKVTFPLIEGGDGVIMCDFKYRTKSEFGQFLDQMSSDAGVVPEEGKPLSIGDLMAKTVDRNADYLLDVLKGWDVDADLTRDNAAQLANELPGACVAIMEAYRLAVVEGRLGN
ncbi:MAG: phage tail assembly chaperone [Pseudorhodoferax sp.]